MQGFSFDDLVFTPKQRYYVDNFSHFSDFVETPKYQLVVADEPCSSHVLVQQKDPEPTPTRQENDLSGQTNILGPVASEELSSQSEIHSENSLVISHTPTEPKWLKIRTVTGQEYQIPFKPSDSLSELKAQIRKRCLDIPEDRLQLFFHRHRLDQDLSTLSNGDTIHVLVSMEGGRHWRRRRVFVTPKKIKYRSSQHKVRKTDFFRQYGLTYSSSSVTSLTPVLSAKRKPRASTNPKERFFRSMNEAQIVRAISQNSSYVEQYDVCGETPLIAAIRQQRYDFAKTLILEHNASLKPALHVKENPIHIAVWNNGVEFLEFLLSRDTSGMNAKNVDGKTPLDVAIMKGYCDIILLLLDRGARHTYRYTYEIKDPPARRIVGEWMKTHKPTWEYKKREMIYGNVGNTYANWRG